MIRCRTIFTGPPYEAARIVPHQYVPMMLLENVRLSGSLLSTIDVDDPSRIQNHLYRPEGIGNEMGSFVDVDVSSNVVDVDDLPIMTTLCPSRTACILLLSTRLEGYDKVIERYPSIEVFNEEN